jgi:hypothetical protein
MVQDPVCRTFVPRKISGGTEKIGGQSILFLQPSGARRHFRDSKTRLAAGVAVVGQLLFLVELQCDLDTGSAKS